MDEKEKSKGKLMTAQEKKKRTLRIQKELKTKKNAYREKLGVADFTYLIQGENNGIRIGYTIHPDITLESLQREYSDNYKLLLVIPEKFKTATQLQNKFEHLKLKDGWLKPDKEIFDEIERLKLKYPHVVGD